MLSRLKTYFWFALAFGAFYFLLSHHIIFTSFTEYDLLKKEELTFKYTFFSLRQTTPEVALRADALRHAGLGELMVEKGMLTQERLGEILRRMQQQ
jgi:hypothetical protein